MTMAFITVKVTEDLDKGSWNRSTENGRRRTGDIRVNSLEGFCGKGSKEMVAGSSSHQEKRKLF